MKDNLVRHNDAIWNQATSPKGLHSLISGDPRRPIASFGLFGEQAKDQTFFQEAQREVAGAKRDFAGKWDQQPLDRGKSVEKELQSNSRLARSWGSAAGSRRGVTGDLKSGTTRSCILSSLSRSPRRCRPSHRGTDESKPTLQGGRRPTKTAEWDHTLRDEKFVQFLTDRQIDRTTLSPQDKTKTKDIARDLFQKATTRLKDNDVMAAKSRTTSAGQVLDSEYSRLLASHDEAKTLLQAAKNFGRDIPQLDALRNTLIAMATRAEEGLRASVESCKTVIAEKTEEGITKYGKDVVDLVKANPDRLGFLLRDKSAPVVFEPGMVDRLIDSLAKGTDREKGDPETALGLLERLGIDFPPVERSDPGRGGAESAGRLHKFREDGNVATSSKSPTPTDGWSIRFR